MMYHSTALNSKINRCCFVPHRLHEAPELNLRNYMPIQALHKLYSITRSNFFEYIMKIKHITTYVVWTLSTGYKNPKPRIVAATIQGHFLCSFLFQEFRTRKRKVEFQLQLPNNLGNISIYKPTENIF